jgi:hypothetical protein
MMVAPDDRTSGQNVLWLNFLLKHIDAPACSTVQTPNMEAEEWYNGIEV